MKHQLSIVDEGDNTIGQDSRENIHKKGLLHREVHVWIYNKKGEILFQKRSLTKDTFPGLLDASVGGHVEIGDGYEKSAIKELEEEVGIKTSISDLLFITKTRSKSYDIITKMTNNTIRFIYAYEFNDNLKKLQIEKGETINLEFWTQKKIFSISEKDKEKFIPSVFNIDTQKCI
ncbi:NUDIX domain-containing protein [Patescibacteria group bacterium]|nr:NUDIX domain-containing protein [Patescibacteria group bacterium]MBU1951606.1 NUDIX domain-containing protein [Patescibacteria group bacterium]